MIHIEKKGSGFEVMAEGPSSQLFRELIILIDSVSERIFDDGDRFIEELPEIVKEFKENRTVVDMGGLGKLLGGINDSQI